MPDLQSLGIYVEFINSERNNMKILISGGGISGLASALALQNHGHDITIIEKSESWQSMGAGLHLPGNAVNMMQRLGIYEEVSDKAFPFQSLSYCTERGKPLFELDTKASGWPEFRALSRKDFHNVLMNRLGNTIVRFGVSVDHISDGACAEVTFSDATEEKFDLVLGADGIASNVRSLVFGSKYQPSYTGFKCWRWISEHPLGFDTPQFMMGCGQVVLIMPIGQDRYYIFACVYDPKDQLHQIPPNILCRHFSSFRGPVADMFSGLSEKDQIQAAPLLQMVMSNWVQGHTILLGDAAHGTLPTLAQGATQAMKDAIILSDMLAEYSDLPIALNAWQASRLPEAHWVQHQSLKRMTLARLNNGLIVSVRNAVLKLAGPQILSSGWAPLIDGQYKPNPFTPLSL